MMAGSALAIGLVTLSTILVSSLTIIATPSLNKTRTDQAKKLATQASHDSSHHQPLLGYRLANLLDPQNPAYAGSLADQYLRQRMPNGAIETLRRLGPGGYQRVAEIQFRTGDCQESLTTINQLLARKPTASAHLIRSKCLMEVGEYSKSQAAARKASQLDPDNTKAHLLLALATSLGKGTSAEVVSAAGETRLSPRIVAIAAGGVALANVLYQEGLFASARQVLENVPEANSSTHLLLAKIYVSKDNPARSDLEGAKLQLQKGLATKPDDVVLHQHLRETLVQLGDGAGAKREEGLVAQLRSGRP